MKKVKPKPRSPFAGEVRYCYGPMKCMAVADGYVMARRPYMMPVVMSARAWLKLSAVDDSAAVRVQP